MNWDESILFIVLILVGTNTLVTKDLSMELKKIGIENVKKKIVKACQQKVFLGSAKIVKSAMKI